MQRFKAPSKFIQYQLWSECRNGCPFCLCKDQIPIDKKYALNFILDKLNDEEVCDFDEVGLIGGEIFDVEIDDPEINTLFYQILDKICNMHFKKIYLATNLIYDFDRHLAKCLEFIRERGAQGRILICTSWDSAWRFSTAKKRMLWESNMRRLELEYPDFKKHIEIILTGDFIDLVLNNQFDIAEFSKMCNARIDFIEPTSGWYYNDKKQLQAVCPNFFPTKDKFIKFLEQECVRKKSVNIRWLISNEIRSSRRYQIDCGQFVCQKDRRVEGFQTVCLDPEKKFETGFIDSDESIEEVCIALCELLDDE